MPWYVLYTKPRNEKKTARLLEEKGIEVYCPVQEVIKQWSDRKKKIIEPVFPSYVFVHLDDFGKENVSVLLTAGAVRFLWWLGKPGIVRDTEISGIKDFLNAYKGVKLKLELEAGDLVMIKEGPLKEKNGEIMYVRGRKAILKLDSLGWNLVAEIAIQSLEPLPDHTRNK